MSGSRPARSARHLGVAGLIGLALAAGAGACGDATRPASTGAVTAALISPNGAEGGAVFSVIGAGVDTVMPVSGQLWSFRHGDSIRVVVVRQDSGDLSFRVVLADSTQRPGVLVLQVAGPDDALRTLDGYLVKFR